MALTLLVADCRALFGSLPQSLRYLRCAMQVTVGGHWCQQHCFRQLPMAMATKKHIHCPAWFCIQAAGHQQRAGS